MARIKSSEMPGFIKPQFATLKARAPKGDHELHPVPKTPSLVFYGTGGASWREGSLPESSSLRLCG
jgi:hypothetical protein